MLWWQEYGLPVAVTSALHIVLLFWLANDFTGKPELPEVKKPKFIKASVVEIKEKREAEKPKPKPPPKPDLEKQKQQEEANRKKIAEEARLKKQREEAARKKAEEEALLKKKREQDAKKKAEQEALKKAEAERIRQQELEQQKRREEQLLQSLLEEEKRQQAAADEVTAMSYIGVIQQAVESNWSRPASARNGMEVLLSIQLVPTGDVVNVSVAKSSGNDAFDRSAIAAVEKTERFPELAELEPHIFEQYYRRFTLLFKPEDLRL